MKNPSQLSDPSTEDQAALWAARLDGSVLSAPDRAALDAWLDADPAHRTLLSTYCQFSADLEQQLPLLEGIKESSAGTRTSLKIARPFPWLRWPTLAGVALTAAAAIGLAFWLAQPRVPPIDNLATPVAQRQTITLADGTSVELNAQTNLRVELSARERHVRLADGEAFFSVSKDAARPFIVETPAGSVRVTGTKFNVRAETASALEITVAEGSVQVRPGATNGGRDASPVALTAGDKLTAGASGVTVRQLSVTDLNDALAWRQGQIVFDDTPLREALARFARYHGRGIGADDDAADLRVGGRYSLDDLDGFFAAIEDVLHVRVTRDLSGTVRVGLAAQR